MTVFNEPVHPGEGCISKANGDRSMENVIFASGNTITPAMVLGQLTANDKFVPLDPSATTGAQVAVAIAYTNVDASEADANGPIYARECEFGSVFFPTGITAEQRATAVAELASRSIILRNHI